MVFSSLPFLFVFLPATIILYFLCPDLKWKNGLLTVASIIFYATGEPVYIVLLVLCALSGWCFGLLIEEFRGTGRDRVFLILCTVVCLSGLFVFKYLDFVIETVNQLFSANIKTTGLALPIGISFYTFQTLSYDIDLYRGKTEVQKSFGKFLLYVSLFPQLIAGPILRYSDIAEQLDYREHSFKAFSDGIVRFLVGCAKKVLIANQMGEIVNTYFADAAPGSGLTVLACWLGSLAYALQIYFDFSGYSDMAIGLGKMFGFQYGENFDHPYISRSVTEFWRRWHISLSSFFRDYVYIPLGGNRRHQLLNLLVVWSLTGLWHGASWNFVVWGLYYFVFLAIEKFLLHRSLEKIPVLGNAVTMIIVITGWTIFYFEDISQCMFVLKTMFGLASAPLWNSALTGNFVGQTVFFAIGIVCCLPIGAPVSLVAGRIREKRPALWLAAVFLFCAFLLTASVSALVSSSYNPFLYFRF